MEKELQALKNNLDRHLENYQRDKDDAKDVYKKLSDQNILILKQLEPMVETFTGSRFTFGLIVSMLKFLGILAAGITATAFLIKGIHKL